MIEKVHSMDEEKVDKFEQSEKIAPNQESNDLQIKVKRSTN